MNVLADDVKQTDQKYCLYCKLRVFIVIQIIPGHDSFRQIGLDISY